MPAPCTADSVTRLWRAESPPSPSSPISCSPPPTPLHLTLLDRRYLPPAVPLEPAARRPRPVPLLLGLAAAFLRLLVSHLFLVLPALWFAGLLTAVRLLFRPLRRRTRPTRTVLISGGSTLQALQMARNFSAAGARVVVFEVEGPFPLCKFSSAVDEFYRVPEPRGERGEEYVEAVKVLASKERAGCYVPVSATSAAYYDALVKPHLELLGCRTFCPGLREVCALEDAYELLRRCQVEGVSTPVYYPVLCREDVYRLYDEDVLRQGRHTMQSVGVAGCRDRGRMVLPRSKRDFRPPPGLSPQRPWLVVRDYPGEHLVTCTVVKDSRVVASVTCREGPTLEPISRPEIDAWIQSLLGKLRLLRPVSGHLSFRFAESSGSGSVVPLGCRVGVSPAYSCFTGVHPRLVWRPCPHFKEEVVQDAVTESGRYRLPQLLVGLRPDLSSLLELMVCLFRRQESVFSWWDPLPYLFHYHLQVPLYQVHRLLRGHLPKLSFATLPSHLAD